jgi:hypothetical protein
LMKKWRLADLFCLHMFCNGAQVTYNVVSITPRLNGIRTPNVSGDRQ